MVLTNRVKKYIRSLRLHKYRQKYNKFVAEGPKIALEFINAQKYHIESIVCVQSWYEDHIERLQNIDAETYICNEKELSGISQLQSANKVLIVAESQKQVADKALSDAHKLIYIDDVQDPGNMGTIIRIADWYGIEGIIQSSNSVDYYNPKVVQSAMGSHNRLILAQRGLDDHILSHHRKLAMDLNGTHIDEITLEQDKRILVLGNEGKGITQGNLTLCDDKIKIPRVGGAESLNVAVACGIACHCIMR